jgi:hypothetical protein
MRIFDSRGRPVLGEMFEDLSHEMIYECSKVYPWIVTTGLIIYLLLRGQSHYYWRV